ncbi:hypothetical protein CYMTET_39506 [Cymbomonas tetramitiformis]|uniref:Magnesium transporter MgtE intracellular domain-containing protein n=1 Tax=Cymbomonas tetramitiformis TaxID=36881 RepID=A0AAE0C9Y9_9CHLO|nr:hypothetical protein CYMTET_39506 [Cymbomonas tetramitiformis]
MTPQSGCCCREVSMQAAAQAATTMVQANTQLRDAQEIAKTLQLRVGSLYCKHAEEIKQLRLSVQFQGKKQAGASNPVAVGLPSQPDRRHSAVEVRGTRDKSFEAPVSGELRSGETEGNGEEVNDESDEECWTLTDEILHAKDFITRSGRLEAMVMKASSGSAVSRYLNSFLPRWGRYGHLFGPKLTPLENSVMDSPHTTAEESLRRDIQRLMLFLARTSLEASIGGSSTEGTLAQFLADQSAQVAAVALSAELPVHAVKMLQVLGMERTNQILKAMAPEHAAPVVLAMDRATAVETMAEMRPQIFVARIVEAAQGIDKVSDAPS